MSEGSFFNIAMLDKLAEQLDGVNAPTVSITKPIARAMVFELRRFYGNQTATEEQRVALVQKLTFEYACQHICDLLRSIVDLDNSDDVRAALLFAISEVMIAAQANNMKAAGNG